MAWTRGRIPSTRRRGEGGGDETTQPGVIGRVHREHVPGEIGARKALGDHRAVQGERGVHVLGEPERR